MPEAGGHDCSAAGCMPLFTVFNCCAGHPWSLGWSSHMERITFRNAVESVLGRSTWIEIEFAEPRICVDADLLGRAGSRFSPWITAGYGANGQPELLRIAARRRTVVYRLMPHPDHGGWLGEWPD